MSNLRIRCLLLTTALLAAGCAAPPAEEPDEPDEPRMSQLVWVDRAGNVLESIGSPMELITGPRLSPDLGRLAVRGRESGNDDIWVLDLGDGSRMRLTSDEAAEMHPAWSPSGDRIAYFSYRNGPADLFARSLEAEAPEAPLVGGPAHEYYPDWAPDGSAVVYHTHDPDTDERDIWTASTAAASEPPVSFVAGPGSQALARLSPDGRHLAYQSDETGRWEIYVVTFPDGAAKFQISTGGGLWPRWNSAGTEIFYFENGWLMGARVSLGETMMAELPTRLFAAETVGMPDPSTSRFNPLYDVAPDGQRFVIVRR